MLFCVCHDRIIIDGKVKIVRRNNLLNKRLTDHITYRIVDNTIYLYQEEDISLNEMNMALKKLILFFDDSDICYVNIISYRIENKRDFYREFGFSFSYYDVNKLQFLCDGKKNKKDYRCYGKMSKREFFDMMNEKKKDSLIDRKEVVSDNSGFVNSMLLLFGGITLLCYFCIQGAIYMVK